MFSTSNKIIYSITMTIRSVHLNFPTYGWFLQLKLESILKAFGFGISSTKLMKYINKGHWYSKYFVIKRKEAYRYSAA